MSIISKTRYAVVGLNHGKEHVEYAVNAPDVELAAICDKDEKALHREAAHAPEARKFSDYDEMFSWGKFDAVVIAVPPFLHKEFTIKALQSGKHVFLEKPLTGSLEESTELREAVKAANDLVFQVGYCVRSSQLIQRLLSIIKNGSLGEVVNVWWHMFLKYNHPQDSKWRNDRTKCGGKLFDCAPHYLDILQLLAGAPFYRLSAFGHEQGRTGVNPDKIPTVASIMLEYQNGAKGSYLLNEVTPHVGNSAYFGVAGTRGIVYGNPWDPSGAGSLKCQLNDGLYLDELTVNGEKASAGHLGFKEQHQAFMNAIRTGQGNPCTIDDAFEVELMMAAIDQSLATGKTIMHDEMLK